MLELMGLAPALLVGVASNKRFFPSLLKEDFDVSCEDLLRQMLLWGRFSSLPTHGASQRQAG